MCKHSTESVDKLSKRQHGLDARGNDPMATQRESKWAAEFIQHPPGDSLNVTIAYFNSLPDDACDNRKVRGMPELKQKLNQLGNNPQPMQFARIFADRNTDIKGIIDQIANPLADARPDLEDKARNLPYFQDRGGPNSKRGRNKGGLPRERRASMDSPHVGITTTQDLTPDTSNVYGANVFHAKGMLRAQLDDETVKEFRKSGAPFIGGASGTMQQFAMQMESVKPIDQLTKQELQEREKVLAMLAVQHVAAGHHSMAECLLGAKPYGYFKDVPDPLKDYDGAMAAFEKHLEKLGMGGGQQPLSRKSENEDKAKKEFKYEDRRAFVKTIRERYQDQLPQSELTKITQLEADAANQATQGEFGEALKILARAENLIRAQGSLVEAQARGNNHVLRPDQLEEKLRAAPKVSKGMSAEYKAVKEALAAYEKEMKALGGRKLNHDRVGLAFEALRALLATAEKAADAYNTKLASKPGKTGIADVMSDLIDRLKTEQTLLETAERESNNYTQLGDVTIEQAIEYARFGIKPGTQAQPNVLKESRITGKEELGSGGIHTVMLIDYATDGINPAEQRAFKPEQEKVRLAQPIVDMGIDPNNPRMGKRNIATKKMAAAAGLGNLIPDASFATVDGKVGLAMQVAKGKTPNKKVPVLIETPEGINDLQEALAAKQQGDPDWKSKIPAKNGLGMRYGYDDQSDKFTREEIRTRVLPLTSPPGTAQQVAAVQQQLTNLQWLDVVCGQVDRHAENYVMNTDQDPPTIMGIDNDLCFGKDRRDPTQQTGHAFSFPPVVDQATFTSLMTMVQNWQQISASLGDELTPEEISATKARLDAVANKLTDLQNAGMVVQDWTQQVNGRSVTEILMDPGSTPSYFKRDVNNQVFMERANMTTP